MKIVNKYHHKMEIIMKIIKRIEINRDYHGNGNRQQITEITEGTKNINYPMKNVNYQIMKIVK
jgi:hypothetical protein